MAIGDDGDFRTLGFGHVLRFPPQGLVGGSGSALLPQFTPPAGSSNEQLPFPPFGSLPVPYPFPGLNFPGFPPILTGMNGGSGGGGGPGTIIVEDLDSSTTYNDIHTVQLIGGGFTTSTPSTGVVEINIPGGGGGSALEYGKITGSTKGANAVWTYTVQRYSGGSISGSPVTAFNLLEYGNTAGSAYGYAVSGAGNDQITGTAYYVRAVPTNAWVRLEQTGDMPGGTAYWFSAPNRIDGGC